MDDQHVKIASNAALSARKIIQKGFGQAQSVELKADRSLVTECDAAAERAIVKVLQSETDYSILTEESGLLAADSPMCWVVDPIDGTTNFWRGQSICAISIALMRDHTILAGVIDLPIQEQLFSAASNGGAHLNGEPIAVSTISHAPKAVLCVEHGRDPRDSQLMTKLIGRLNSRFRVRLMGSTAYEMTLVARGQAEAFISCGDKLWDYAAGLLLIREAGGKILDWQGCPWQNQNAFVYASNGHVDEEILPILSEIYQKCQVV